MIQSGSSSIADVKFGSQQIAKVCYGSDLVWEKDSWTALHIGDDCILSTFLTGSGTGKATANGGSGEFYLYDNIFSPILNVFDGDENTSAFNTNNTSKPYFVITFPFLVKVQSITIIDAPNKGIISGYVSYSPKRYSNGFISPSDAGNGYYANFTSRSGNETTTFTNDELVDEPIRALCVYSRNQYKGIAEWKMTVLVETSVYNSWKQKNAEVLANATIV